MQHLLATLDKIQGTLAFKQRRAQPNVDWSTHWRKGEHIHSNTVASINMPKL